VKRGQEGPLEGDTGAVRRAGAEAVPPPTGGHQGGQPPAAASTPGAGEAIPRERPVQQSRRIPSRRALPRRLHRRSRGRALLLQPRLRPRSREQVHAYPCVGREAFPTLARTSSSPSRIPAARTGAAVCRRMTRSATARLMTQPAPNSSALASSPGEWNEKLGELESLEHEHQQVLRRGKVELTSQDRARLLELAKDLSYVWHARSTTNAERKNLLRILVREVVLSPVDAPERGIHLQVLWQTGTCSDFTLARRPSHARATSPEAIKLIGTLAEERSDREVAAELNRRGLLSGVKHAWDKEAVRWVRKRYGLRRQPTGRRGRPRQPERRADGLYSLHGVAALLGVTEPTVRSWVEKGWLRCVEGGGPGSPRWFRLDRSTLKQLRATRNRGNEPSGRRPAQINAEEEGHYA
jgi:hypothetical protein